MVATRSSEPGQRNKGIYRPEIDGLRAFAVVAVIINHFNSDRLPGGYLGVDIFFVISGYVITASLATRQAHSLTNFLLGFYGRRIKRLLPALLVCISITSLLLCLVDPNPAVRLGVAWRSLFGFSNITLYNLATDYFSSATEINPFTHTWSLGVGEQFYLLFPFLVWWSGHNGRLARCWCRSLSLGLPPR
jgi:peptidoglycan/LPS O-acetylase OafA/YrhL